MTDAASWCLGLPEQIGVAAVPFAPFTDAYSDEWSHLVRFAFCKRPEVLDEMSTYLLERKPDESAWRSCACGAAREGECCS